LASINKETN